MPNNRRCVVSGNYALIENIDVSNTHRRFGRRCDRKLHYDSCLPATDTTRRPLETESLSCMILCASSASVIVLQPYNSTVIVCKLDFRKHHTTQFHTHLPPFHVPSSQFGAISSWKGGCHRQCCQHGSPMLSALYHFFYQIFIRHFPVYALMLPVGVALGVHLPLLQSSIPPK